MANEPYFTRYSKKGKVARDALPDSLRDTLQEIEDKLSEDPDECLLHSVELADDLYLYIQPKIQMTYRINRERQTIEYLHVVAPLTEVRKPVFISYSHKDKRWLLELKKFLAPLEKKELIEIWDDQQIQAGGEWHKEIDKALSSAKAALLLVSQNFLTSEFITENELPYLLDAAKNRGLIILWVAVRKSTVDDTEIKGYQALHEDPPLNKLNENEREEVYFQIYEKIKAVAEA